MKVKVYVTRRREIADPQGKAVRRALRDLGHQDVTDVRVDKVITLELDSTPGLRERVDEMCRKLLANPVMEDYEIVIAEEVEAPR